MQTFKFYLFLSSYSIHSCHLTFKTCQRAYGKSPLHAPQSRPPSFPSRGHRCWVSHFLGLLPETRISHPTHPHLLSPHKLWHNEHCSALWGFSLTNKHTWLGLIFPCLHGTSRHGCPAPAVASPPPMVTQAISKLSTNNAAGTH